MSNRIDFIVSSIDRNSVGIADIGTDHGYVPILLAKSNFSGNIIASDINRLPLDKALKNAKNESVSNKIDFLISDGLAEIDRNRIDTVIISGMGGELICRILDECEWIFDRNYTLILNPASRSEILVYWLDNNGFDISEDRLISDNGRICRILKCRYTCSTPKAHDIDLYCGIRNICPDTGLYHENLIGFQKTLIKIISGLSMSGADRRIESAFYRRLLYDVNYILSEVENGK